MKRIGDEHGWQSNPLLVRLVAKGRYGRKSGIIHTIYWFYSSLEVKIEKINYKKVAARN